MLGIKAKGVTFLELWSSIISNIQDIQWTDTCMGISCIIILLLMRVSFSRINLDRAMNEMMFLFRLIFQLLVSIKFGPADDAMKSTCHRVVNKLFWLIGTARNAILVVITGLIAYILHESGQNDLKLIGEIPAGMPDFQFPPFSIPDIRNETTGELIQKGETFSEMVSAMGSSLIVIPLIALLENIAVCKAFGRQIHTTSPMTRPDANCIRSSFLANGKSVDATQELLAIGASNIVNSFAQGFPGTGSLSRGAVNNASGVRTPMGSLYTGVLVILALLFMTPLFFYIPKAALASIIIAAVIFMVEVRVVMPMWRRKSRFSLGEIIPNQFIHISFSEKKKQKPI